MRRFGSILVLGVLLVGAVFVPACGGKKSAGTGLTTGTPKELDSGDISGGNSFPHTFTSAGTFTYCCSRHGCSQMNGSVTVAMGQPMNAAVSIVDFAFQPTSISVAPGGTVTWTNNGSALHTVTSN